jgi:GTP-binding protein LepA
MGELDGPARAMIFDSVYDSYRGVITYVRVFDGSLSTRDKGLMMSTQNAHEILEVGVVSPEMTPTATLSAGEVGYVIPGVKNVRQARVGDTLTTVEAAGHESLAGYQDAKPMVFSGLYPLDGSEYPALREALDKLRLNDAALVYEPETSAALGFGFRVGFLGLLHLEIVRERLEREAGLALISTAPNVVYRVVLETGEELVVTNPSDWPSGQKIAHIYEPVAKAMVLLPSDYVGAGHGAVPGPPRHPRRDGLPVRGPRRAALHAADGRDHLRLLRPAEVAHQGLRLARLRDAGELDSDLVKVDILLQGEPVDAFSAIVHKDKAYAYGTTMATKLRELIPRQQFEVPIQAAIGARVIARENIRAIRKDVLAKCYGGDITRKRKLLEKQKEGKKRMKMVGRVEVPQEAFIAALSTGQETAGKP